MTDESPLGARVDRMFTRSTTTPIPNWNAWLFLMIALIFAGVGVSQWSLTPQPHAAATDERSELEVEVPAGERLAVRAISLNHQGEYLDVMRGPAGWQRRDAHTGRLLTQDQLATGWLVQLQLRSRDDSWIAVNLKNELEIVHAQRTAWRSRLPEQGREESLTDCSLCAEHNCVAVVSSSGNLWLLNFNEQAATLHSRYQFDEPLASVSVSPRGDQLLLITGRHEILLWNVPEARIEWRFDGQQSGIRFAVWSGDGSRFIAFGMNRVLQIRDRAGELVREMELQSHAVIAAALSQDGRLLAVGDGEALRLWEVDADREPAILDGHETLISTVAFDDEGRALFSGDTRGVIRRWALLDHREVWMTP